MNLFSFTGNLGRDAEVKQTTGGSVCAFSVAVTTGYGDKKQTVWVSCSLWGKRAEGPLPQYLVKGQKVAINGELSTREHEGKTYIQIRVNQIDLTGRNDNQAPQQQQAPAQPQPVQQPPAQQQNQQGFHNPPQGQQAPQQPPSFDSFDDDLPY